MQLPQTGLAWSSLVLSIGLMRRDGRPIMTKHQDREDVTQDHVNDDPSGEGKERLAAGGGEFAQPRSQPDAEEAECEGPSAKRCDGGDERWFHSRIVLAQGVTAHNHRCEN